MAGRVQTVKLAVQHVRQPGQRMPVGRIGVGESPAYRRSGQTTLDLGVACDVAIVVEGEEVESDRGQIDRQVRENEQGGRQPGGRSRFRLCGIPERSIEGNAQRASLKPATRH